ncbi:hypothetical protein HRI_001654100 [Hibiscus trionum]|uniref:Uncharacterized protein n=1 Tax=Hibiscus trionum TaxID=183268 RepID=A0A9W7LX90_HIBTR|nr:hypothetical protein HRI_001654100 [Hibiscus trionum]
MEKWREWLCFKRSVAFLTKYIVLKVKMHLRPKAAEKRQGLLGLYKDMECCGEYEDIQVMWNMIHSSRLSSTAHKTRTSKRAFYWRFGFCFKPT